MIEIYDVNESFTHIKINGDIDYGKIIIDTLSVFEEGYMYSALYRSHCWDGKKHFYDILDNQIFQIPKGLVQYIEKDLNSRHKQYSYKKIESKVDLTKEEFSEFIKTLNIPFEPYDYQEKAAFDIIKEKRMVISAATSAGKSLILYLITRWMLANNNKMLVIVPSTSLVEQMSSDFLDYGWKDNEEFIKKIGGENKNKDISSHPVIISTWQSAQNFPKKVFDPIDTIIVDEAHSVGSGDVLDNIIKNATNAKWKCGMTGSIPKIRTAKLQLLGTLGPVRKVINAGGLIERGLASPLDINCIYLKHSNFMVDEFYRNNNNKPKYPDEEKYLATDEIRNNKVAKLLIAIAKTGNTVGLFSKTAHGELLLKKVIKERTNIQEVNINLLHKFTPLAIKKAYEIFQDNKESIFYVNREITDEDLKKAHKNLKKIALDNKDSEEFIKRLKSLVEINVFMFNGAVETTTREFQRKRLETINNDNTSTFEFDDFSIIVDRDSDVKLSNGIYKKAYEITEDDDICDLWIKENKNERESN